MKKNCQTSIGQANTSGSNFISDSIVVRAKLILQPCANLIVEGNSTFVGPVSIYSLDIPDTIYVDHINEHTLNHGTIINNVLIKNSDISTAGTITANTFCATGSVLTDVINEKTTNTGVTIEGVLIKNGVVHIPCLMNTPTTSMICCNDDDSVTVKLAGVPNCVKIGANTTNLNMGYQSLLANTTGSNNTTFGTQSLLANTTGSNNTTFGTQSLLANTTGLNNSSFGTQALKSNTTGSYNTTFGTQSLITNTTGSNNTIVGSNSALLSNGSGNTIVGRNSGNTNTTGSNNTIIGINADSCLNTGINNVAIGNTALTTNNNGVAVGSNTTANTNSVAIGYGTTANLSGSVALGANITANQAGGLFVQHRTTSANTIAGFITGTNELVDTNIAIGGMGSANYLYVYDTVPQTVITANQWYDITFNTNVLLNGWSHTNGSALFTCGATGIYNVFVMVTFNKLNGQNIESALKIVLDGVNIPASLQHYHMHTSATDHTVAILDIAATINSGQVLKIQMTCDTSSAVQTFPELLFEDQQPGARLKIVRFA
jgi:hypothetical protein